MGCSAPRFLSVSASFPLACASSRTRPSPCRMHDDDTPSRAGAEAGSVLATRGTALGITLFIYSSGFSTFSIATTTIIETQTIKLQLPTASARDPDPQNPSATTRRYCKLVPTIIPSVAHARRTAPLPYHGSQVMTGDGRCRKIGHATTHKMVQTVTN